ncbi:hypothetical protein DENSPDRAFT_428973 [Dentipellis sp. KUC8613]|nr:hypothetical protein DENSPDRAFT_428973 [Dentipellis sp. KUC8613]
MMEHLVPLLPLLQSIPLHIDVSKIAVVEKVRETMNSVHQAIVAIPIREVETIAEPRRQGVVSSLDTTSRVSSRSSRAYAPFPKTPTRRSPKKRRLSSILLPPSVLAGSGDILFPRSPQSSVGQDESQVQHNLSQERSIPLAQPPPPLSLEENLSNPHVESTYAAPERDIIRTSMHRAQTAYLLGYSASSHSTHTPSGSRTDLPTSSTSVTAPPSAGIASHNVSQTSSVRPLPSMPSSSDVSRSVVQSPAPLHSESATRRKDNIDDAAGPLVSSGPSLLQPSSLPSPGPEKSSGAPSLRARRMHGETVNMVRFLLESADNLPSNLSGRWSEAVHSTRRRRRRGRLLIASMIECQVDFVLLCLSAWPFSAIARSVTNKISDAFVGESMIQCYRQLMV